MVSLFLLLDDSLYFSDVLFPTIPFGDVHEDLFSMLYLVVVHQNVGRLFQEKVENDEQGCEGNELEENHEIHPIKLDQVKQSQQYCCDTPELKMKLPAAVEHNHGSGSELVTQKISHDCIRQRHNRVGSKTPHELGNYQVKNIPRLASVQSHWAKKKKYVKQKLSRWPAPRGKLDVFLLYPKLHSWSKGRWMTPKERSIGW